MLPISVQANQWEEVDTVRAAAGLVPLEYSEALSVAAGNHAAYLVQNMPLVRGATISAHDESSSWPLFSGQTASDRAIYAGYAHRKVTENISTGNASARESVRSLMSAIYHRFGFLSFDINAIGIAEQGERYVYNMGRRDLEQACLNPTSASLLQKRVSCNGEAMRASAYAQLCQSLPNEARYQPPYAKQCPDGTRLKRQYVEAICAQPPAEALHRGTGRYYQLCQSGTRFKASWFEGLCAAPLFAAEYKHSGSYYEICGKEQGDTTGQVKVHADWYTNYCANLAPDELYTDSGRFYKLCYNDTPVRAEYLDEVEAQLRHQNPEFVLWPVPGGSDVPPAFFEENPDPLPDFSVSGYPISLQFNPALVKQASISQFTLERYGADQSGGGGYWQAEPNIRFINAQNDPNQKFEVLQFAWFPLNRLEWNTDYRVTISALVDGNARQFSSVFTTEDLKMPLAKIWSDTEKIDANNGEWLALYQEPTDIESTPFQNVNFSYPSGAQVDLDMVDPQTIKVRVSGARCHPVTLTLNSGRQLGIETCG